MEDLKKIQEFFSKPLKENIVVRMYNTTDKTADLYKEDNPGLEFYLTGKEGQDYVRKYKDHISFPFSSHMNDGTPTPNYEENKEKLAAYLKQKGIPFKTTSTKPLRYVSRTTGEDFMATTDTFKVPLSHVDIKDISLEENTTNWPKEVPSRYGDIIFRLVKVMPDRAKYELIDAETGRTWEIGGRVYGTVDQLKAAADDLIKPQGGRQSSHFESVNEDKKLTYNNFVQMVRDDMMAGAAPDEYPSDERVRKDAKYLYNRYLQGASVDDLFEASLGSTKSQSLANAINSAMLQIDDSMSYTDFANAVASILIDEYGTHNFTPFMEVLHARLGMNEATEEEENEDQIDIITMDVPLFIRVLEYAREDAQADMDLHDLTEKAIAATKQQGILQMDDYDMLVGELEQLNEEFLNPGKRPIITNKQGEKFVLQGFTIGGYYLIPYDGYKYWEHFRVPKDQWIPEKSINWGDYNFTQQQFEKLKAFNSEKEKEVNKKFQGMNESLNEADLNNATKEEYNALLDKEYELTKAYNKDKTDANWKKLSDIRKKGKKLEKELEDQGLLEASKEEENEFHKKLDKLVHKTFGHSSDEKKKSIAQTLAETIKLGEGVIEEELCPKGKAYIKRRKAAGEKSSAYLSGRAVKVCKGQMSGRKKRKSKKK